jgi:hypothetical protein
MSESRYKLACILLAIAIAVVLIIAANRDEQREPDEYFVNPWPEVVAHVYNQLASEGDDPFQVLTCTVTQDPAMWQGDCSVASRPGVFISAWVYGKDFVHYGK